MKTKTTKKLVVSSLATLMAASMVGAITGTVAWYQYNTRVTASIIGMNVAETGTLQISKDASFWTRDLGTADLAASTKITPVTFDTNANQANGSITSLEGVTAYKNPNASKNVDAVNAGHTAGNYEDVFETSTDYIQFSLYLRARTVDHDPSPANGDGFTTKSEKVYLSEFILDNLASSFDIKEGLRVHIACYDDFTGYTVASGTRQDGVTYYKLVDDVYTEMDAAAWTTAGINVGDDLPASTYYTSSQASDRNYLISNGTAARAAMPLSGKLDCDDDGYSDRVGGYEWQEHRDDVVTYGENYTQTTILPATLVSTPVDGVFADAPSKLIVTTPAEEGHYSKITVTLWLEGWDNVLGTKSVQNIEAVNKAKDDSTSGLFVDRYATQAAGATAAEDGVFYQKNANDTVPMWSGLNTDGAQFKFGMTFAVSTDAFKD